MKKGVYVREDLYNELKKIAQIQGKSITELVNNLLLRRLYEFKKEIKKRQSEG